MAHHGREESCIATTDFHQCQHQCDYHRLDTEVDMCEQERKNSKIVPPPRAQNGLEKQKALRSVFNQGLSYYYGCYCD